jgi:flagellar basal-body rod protein FlgF
MENTTTITLSRLLAQSRAMDVIATNIANAGTPGYRAERTIFSDYLVHEPGGALPSGETALTYSADRATYRERQAGSLTHTGDPLDLAITSDGYFTVQTANGPRLTRSGHFSLSASGGIVDVNGNALLDGTGQPIQVGATDTRLSVAADGTISSDNGQVGKVAVVSVADPFKVKSEGGRLLSAVDTTTSPAAAPKIVQGAIEESNVQPTLEVTRMMTDVREFQFVTQFIQAEADRQQSAIDKLLQTHS